MARMMCGRAGEPAVRKGPWTLEEDLILVGYISKHGEGSWDNLARSAGLNRNGKSCRLRWLNYLRPGLRRGSISPEEEMVIRELHARLGNKWAEIAKHLPGRTDNEVKNYWRTRIHKKPPSCCPDPASMAANEVTTSSVSASTTSQASSTVGDEYTQTSFPYPDLSWSDAERPDVIAATTRFLSEFSDNFWFGQGNFWEDLPPSGPAYEAISGSGSTIDPGYEAISGSGSIIDPSHCCN